MPGDEDFGEPGFYVPVDVPLLVMNVLILAANGLVVELFRSTRTLRTPSNAFLASLAVSDGVSSVLGVPLLIACSATTTEAACIPSSVFLRFSAVCAMLHLLMIASDRYGCIVHPLKYPSHMCAGAAAVLLCAVYLVSAAVALAQLSWLDFSTLDVNQDAEARIIEIEKRYFLACFVAFFCVPVALTSFCYARILHVSLGHHRAILKQRSCSPQPSLLRALGRYRGSLVLWAMFFVFTVSLLPNFILGLQHHMGDELFGEFPLWVENAIVFLRFTPPLTNPVLCTFFKQDFRAALGKWWAKHSQCLAGSCLSLRAKPKQQQQERWKVTYTSAARASRAASTVDTFLEYSRSKSARDSTHFPDVVEQPNDFLDTPTTGPLEKDSVSLERT